MNETPRRCRQPLRLAPKHPHGCCCGCARHLAAPESMRPVWRRRLERDRSVPRRRGRAEP